MVSFCKESNWMFYFTNGIGSSLNYSYCSILKLYDLMSHLKTNGLRNQFSFIGVVRWKKYGKVKTKRGCCAVVVIKGFTRTRFTI